MTLWKEFLKFKLRYFLKFRVFSGLSDHLKQAIKTQDFFEVAFKSSTVS